MTPNQIQARWISERGHVDSNIIQALWPTLLQQPHLDLCSLLVQHGHLSPEQAQYVRAQIRKDSSDFVSPVEETKIPSSASSASHASFGQSSAPFQHPDYEVLGELGRGGMGVVYLGRQVANGAEVVIKCLIDTSRDGDLEERFQREARVLGQFNHENIVAIKDFGFHRAQPYIVMNRIDGIDLSERVKQHLKVKGVVPEEEWVIQRLIALGRGLEECHKKGIIHRDLKPANVMIENESERPILIDFGVAHINAAQSESEAFESMSEDLTKTGTTVGTPEFMAPEQLDGAQKDKPITHKADVWAFGATLYFCLTGEAPYTGSTPYSIYKKLIESDPGPPSSINAKLPRWLDDICLRTMVRDPDQRPEMSEVIDWLEQLSAPPKKRITPPFLFALVFLIFATTFAYYYFRLPEDHVIPTIPKLVPGDGLVFVTQGDGRYLVHTKSKEVSVQFRCYDENLLMIVARDKATKRVVKTGRSDGGGLFTLKLPVKKDKCEFLISGRDIKNNEGEVASLAVLFDETIPQISEFIFPKRLHSDSLDGPVSFVLEGKLDELDCEVSYKETKAAIDGLRFSLPITLDKRIPSIKLVLRDRVGLYRETEVPIRVVGSQRKGGRTHSNLDSALGGVRDNWHIYVRPGVYRSIVKISANVRIRSSGEKGEVRIQSKKGTLVTVESRMPPIKASIDGLGLFHGPGVKENLIELREGELTLNNCELQGYKILALCGPDRATGKEAPKASLSLTGCRLTRYWAYGIVARRTKLTVTDCEFIDRNSNPSGGWYGKEDSRDPFFHRGALVVRDGSILTVKGSRFQNTKHRHMFIYKSRAVIEDCDFFGSYEDGLYFSSESVSTVKKCNFEDGAEETIIGISCKSLLLEECHIKSGGRKFFKDAKDGVVEDGISAAILLRDGAKVTIRNSSVKNYAGSGLFLEDNQQKNGKNFRPTIVKVFDSEFSENGGSGAIVQMGQFYGENSKFSKNKLSGLFGKMGGQIQCERVQIHNNQDFGIFLKSRSGAEIYNSTIKENKPGREKIIDGSVLEIDGEKVK